MLAGENSDGGALIEKLREVAAQERNATFTLVVPAKPTFRSLTWTQGATIAEARRTAIEASSRLKRSGLRVDQALIGDASPVQAIADILTQSGPYDGIVIANKPTGISRWLKLDAQARVRHRFSLPVIFVFARREAVAIA